MPSYSASVASKQKFIFSFKIFQHTSHNVGIFAKRFAWIILRLQQLQIDGKTGTIATESVDLMDLTDTNPENNWYQFYTNYKWIGTKWKAYRLLVLSLDIDFVKWCKVVGAEFRNGLCTVVIHQRKGTGVHECHELLNCFFFFFCATKWSAMFGDVLAQCLCSFWVVFSLYPSETFCKYTNIVTGVLENFERMNTRSGSLKSYLLKVHFPRSINFLPQQIVCTWYGYWST